MIVLLLVDNPKIPKIVFDKPANAQVYSGSSLLLQGTEFVLLHSVVKKLPKRGKNGVENGRKGLVSTLRSWRNT